MRDYKTNTYYSCKKDLPVIIGAIVCGYLVAELAWIEIFNYFGFWSWKQNLLQKLLKN